MGTALLAGGILIFAVLVFQILLGTRKIKFKGPLHWKIHRWAAFAMLGLAIGHALGGLYMLGYIRF